MTVLADLEPRAVSKAPLTRAEAERVIACPDLVSIGMLGEASRKAWHGDRVTYVRVCTIGAAVPADPGEAGEVRIVASPGAADEAVDLVRASASCAGRVTLTGFSLADLFALVGGDHLALVDLAKALKRAGLAAVAALPVDRFADEETAVETVRAAVQGGLRVPRATVERGAFGARLDLIERADRIARETGALHAFAPLPEHDPAEAPSTGYDDVKTVALARLCTAIRSIQVSWPLYGPKLAQVAIAYGADDLDAVPATNTVDLGPRRSAREDIERQIRAAFAVPVERTGLFEAGS